jgi:hypothetical protein
MASLICTISNEVPEFPVVSPVSGTEAGYYSYYNSVQKSSVPDPRSGAFLTLDLGSGMGKNLDPGSGSRMNIPDHISVSLKTIFWVKNI